MSEVKATILNVQEALECGRDALLAELGRAEVLRDELVGQERAIREYLKGKR